MLDYLTFRKDFLPNKLSTKTIKCLASQENDMTNVCDNILLWHRLRETGIRALKCLRPENNRKQGTKGYDVLGHLKQAR